MKTKLFFALFLISSHMFASSPISLSEVNSDEFKTGLNRIISAAFKNKFSPIKGDSSVTIKNSITIIKWNATDSLPGQQSGYICKSFCTSFRGIFAESTELNAELVANFDAVNTLISQSLSSSWWHFNTETKADGTKKTNISRMSRSEQNIYPDLNLEIIKKDGKYILQLSVSI